MTTHATVLPEVETMTDRILNWFGWDHAYDYRLRPYAMIAACDLYASGVRPESLTREDIESADARNGGKLTAMFNAIKGKG